MVFRSGIWTLRGEIQMSKVSFPSHETSTSEIRILRGRLKRTKPERPVTFDDIDSFSVEIDRGEVAISPASLSAHRTLMCSTILRRPRKERSSAPRNHVSLILKPRISEDSAIFQIHPTIDISENPTSIFTIRASVVFNCFRLFWRTPFCRATSFTLNTESRRS